MPIGWPFIFEAPEPALPEAGRPRRDRKKINAARRAGRHNRKK